MELMELSKQHYELIVIGINSLVAIIVSWMALRQGELTSTMEQLEINTNAIKDALVKSTEEAALARGNLQGRKEQTAEKRKRGAK